MVSPRWRFSLNTEIIHGGRIFGAVVWFGEWRRTIVIYGPTGRRLLEVGFIKALPMTRAPLTLEGKEATDVQR